MEGTQNQLLWEKALLYTKTWKYAIIKKASSFLKYSSYSSVEDFLRESDLIAFTTLKDIENIYCSCCKRKSDDCFFNCENFLKVFWGRLKARFSELADIPNKTEIDPYAGSKAPATKINITEIYEENENAITLRCEESTEDKLIKKEEKEKHIIDENLKEKIFQRIDDKSKQLIILLKNGFALEDIQRKLGYQHKQGLLMKVKRLQEKIQKIMQNIQKEEQQLSLFIHSLK